MRERESDAARAQQRDDDGPPGLGGNFSNGALTQARLARIREPPWRGAQSRRRAPARGAARLATIETGASDPEPWSRCRLPVDRLEFCSIQARRNRRSPSRRVFVCPPRGEYGRTAAMKSSLLFLLVAPIAAAQAPPGRRSPSFCRGRSGSPTATESKPRPAAFTARRPSNRHMISSSPGGQTCASRSPCSPPPCSAPPLRLRRDRRRARREEPRSAGRRREARRDPVAARTGRLVFGFGDAQIDRVGAGPEAPGMIRTEITLQGLTQFEAYDGKEGWTLEPFEGRRDAQKDAEDDARDRARDADIDGPLVDWREKGHRVEYLGTEDVDGTPAHKLRVDLKDGDIEYVFLDPDSFLEIRDRDGRARPRRRADHRDRPRRLRAGRRRLDSRSRSSRGRRARPRSAAHHGRARRGQRRRRRRALPLPARRERRSGASIAAPGAAPAPPRPRRPPPSGAAARARRRSTPASISGLGARNIGSAAMSGRIAAVAGRNEGGKTTLFVGAASGGVWKSQRRRHDVQAGLRQAARAVDRRDRDRSRRTRRRSGSAPASRGRATPSRSATASTSRPTAARPGRTWACRESERIVRILVHPKNGDVVYACVPGKLWSDSADRGLYKTTDGGKTWALVLKGGEPLDRLLGPRDGSEEPRRALRRAVGLPPQGLDVPLRRRRARRAERQRPLPLGRRRQDVDGARRRRRTRACRRSRGAASRSSIAPSDSEDRLRAHRVGGLGALPLRRRRRDLGGARQEPEDGVAAVLLRAARRRSDERRPPLQARRRPHRQRGRRQELRRRGRRRRTATGTTSGSIPTTRSTSSAATTAASGSPTTAATAGGRRTTCRSRSSTT